jgi:hypothetical protein
MNCLEEFNLKIGFDLKHYPAAGIGVVCTNLKNFTGALAEPWKAR